MTFEEAIGQLKCNVEGDYINLDDLEAFNLAIPALEKQIPKKATNLSGRYWGKAKSGTCPKCQSGVNSMQNHYCSKCGQALDWSDTNDRGRKAI